MQRVGQPRVFCVAEDEPRKRVVALFAGEPVVRADFDVRERSLDRVGVDRQLQPAAPHHRVVGDAGEVVGHARLVVVDEVARTVGRPVDPVDAAAESHRLGVGEVDGERREGVARASEPELERPRNGLIVRARPFVGLEDGVELTQDARPIEVPPHGAAGETVCFRGVAVSLPDDAQCGAFVGRPRLLRCRAGIGLDELLEDVVDDRAPVGGGEPLAASGRSSSSICSTRERK